MTRRWAWVVAVAALVVCAPAAAAEPLDLVGAYDPGTGGLNASAIAIATLRIASRFTRPSLVSRLFQSDPAPPQLPRAT